ncbi:MAG: thioredoxin family protein [Bacteroidetes bacterium]|nr:thioredoxin family protein [Bacteroidota bacterium]
MNTLTSSDYASYWSQAVPFETYTASVEAEANSNPTVGNSKYVPINWRRMHRIMKTAQLSNTTLKVLSQLHKKVRWLVITENWCGDSAQSTPIMHMLAEASNGSIELRFIYRDANLPLMNAHLTGMSMSIPKVIQLDADFNVTGTWGPRPDKAQQMVLRLKSNPTTAPTYNEELHRWYAQDKQMGIEDGLVELIKEAIAEPSATA